MHFLATFWAAILGFGLPGGGEWLAIAFIGLLIFGRRLPQVARQLGGAMSEFKKGLRDAATDDPYVPTPKIESTSEPKPPIEEAPLQSPQSGEA